ncbi:MAG: putative inorganic carbon transporter subunit DabA [Acidimicrobiales bacterium]
MIIGPRSLTRGVDLERRAFLHSYEADRDADSSTLAAILAGPLVVAHGISSLYRLSAIDPERCGAGTKTAHSLVGGVGVLDHPGGDLRTGLPRESVGAMAGVAHEPLRLLVVIDATTEQVDRALAAVESVATLARNGWIRIAARPTQSAPDEAPWMLLTRNLGWVPWDGHPGVDSHRHDDERVAVPA